MVNLISKLSSLKNFSELSVIGIRLNTHVVEGLCQLAKSSNLSALFLGGTFIGTDGALKLTEALSCGPQEFVKLDLASCGINLDNVAQISANIVRINGIVELNLGGNFITDRGCYALVSLLTDPQCNLKSLILDRCHLGLGGILRIVLALAGNEYLEELHLAGNSDIADERALECRSITEASTSDAVCNTNAAQGELEVADSEDEDASRDDPSKRNSSVCSPLIEELSVGISLAKQLQLLDLSCNYFSNEAIENMYMSWSSARSKSSQLAYKHVKDDQVLHFCVLGRKCCSVRNCCKKD